MNTIDWGKLLQRGYYVTLGFTSILLEIAQDATKREERIKDLDRFLDELVAKGVSTEAEARSYVDQIMARGTQTSKTEDGTTVTAVATTVADNTEQELRELTEQIAKLRQELEQLRAEKQ
ncbi:MAG: hypothetical protein RMK91_02350 [Pseudanabaenaceae cyanobacterium SKYGB_i_bin29]|nr:hypothetical protein [Pseudanabaenaceae cyanobacterium SKYG29]MDW8420687.1 hypothetical protein [Pseudanabaenaceae cyanobacterium SKYGB_i_bin29]